MTQAYICDAIRTPIGRYGGAFSSVRADDLAAIPIRALIARNPGRRLGRASTMSSSAAPIRRGRDNRNLARMAGLLAGLPDSSGGVTLNRLCGSGPRRGRDGRARDPRRRRRPRHRRRQREEA